jgi:hypothetical protein
MESNQQDSLAIIRVLEDYYLKGICESEINVLEKIYFSRTLSLIKC